MLIKKIKILILILLSGAILFVSGVFWLGKEWENEAYPPCWCGSESGKKAWFCSDKKDYKNNPSPDYCPDSFENK